MKELLKKKVWQLASGEVVRLNAYDVERLTLFNMTFEEYWSVFGCTPTVFKHEEVDPF